MTFVLYPPHSPDFTPCDFALFPRLKIKLKGHHFDTIEVIEAESQAVLNTHRTRLPGAFKKWQKHWEGRMMAEGDYFKCDGDR
jgi:hypothetical protein